MDTEKNTQKNPDFVYQAPDPFYGGQNANDIDVEATLGSLLKRIRALEGLGNVNTNLSDAVVVNKKLQLVDAKDILFGGNKGTRIGTDVKQKLAFWKATPVIQPNAISAPSGGGTVDSQARTAINTIISTLQTLGLTA